MVQFHPPLSGMPLAFATLLVVAELMRLKQAWRCKASVVRGAALVGCLLATLAAFFSGYQASDGLPDLEPPLAAALSTHHAWGRILLIDSVLLCTFAWISRIATHGKKMFEGIYYTVLLLFIAGVLYVGSLGGALVFEHGLGVTYSPVNAPSTDP
jgi:uncharacterized membrane protein